MDLGLRDKVCVVTGSTGGIGLVVAEQLLAEGARVVTSGRRGEGVGSLHVSGDLAQPGQAERVVEEAVRAFGRLDVLVNNVGFAYQAKLEDLTDAQWDELWQLNVMSYIRAIRAAVPHMRAQGGGTIVNVSSTAGKRPSVGMPNYSVTKAAVNRMTEALSVEWSKFHINVNAIAPGAFASEMMDGMIERMGGDFSKYTPRKRLGDPAQLDSTLLYLCAPASEFVTGTVIRVDDGQGAK